MQVTPLTGISDNPPNILPITQDKFDRGVISLIDQSKLPKNALKTADNLTLAEDGAPLIRPGVGWYGTAASASAIDGGEMFVTTDDVIHLIKVAGGKVYRSLNNGTTWTECTGATFTSGKKVHFEQGAGYMYLYNGYDNIIRYDGTTTLQSYTTLATPVGNTPTKTGLGGTTSNTYRYRVAAVNDIGYTLASTAQTIAVDRARDSFDATNFVSFTWTAVPSAVRYDIYIGEIAGLEYYVASVEGQATTTYQDRYQTPAQTSILPPESNTTQGPRVGDMALIGVRLFACKDRDYPYRLWISGAGPYIGYFSSAYDATYIDLQKGGRNKPVKAEDYRDGKGTPLATVWCDSVDGKGCIWQGTVESFTVGAVTFPVPNFYRLPGSRGTNAPDSVINVLNDYMYYNSQAFYNLGSRAQFLNLLSTDEASANIRPDVKAIRQSASSGICAFYQDAKVYFSVPYDSDTNNAVIVYDTERKAWLPRSFNEIGFERFFAYTDTTGEKHILCWKTGDTKFSEISESIKGDYGVAFRTTLSTGLQHVNPRNRFEFAYCEEAEIEFALTQGLISIELSAITREDGYRVIGTRNIEPATTKYSWTTHKWGGHKWTDTGVAIVSYSEPSLKRYFEVLEDINAYQYVITTETLNAGYLLRTLQVEVTASQAGKPREWELIE